MYSVSVGNVGEVYCGDNLRLARLTYNAYVDRSLSNQGRCGGESVTLFQDEEPIEEFWPSISFPDNGE